jgi:hypothetical protein
MSLRALAISLLSLAAVLFMGTAHFGADRTAVLVVPLLKMGTLSAADVRVAFPLLRKVGHVAEYAVLALAWFAALSTGRLRTPRRAAWLALAVCLACAFVDEAHQAMILTRSASTRDLWLDATGAVLALMVARLYRQWRNGGPGSATALALSRDKGDRGAPPLRRGAPER